MTILPNDVRPFCRDKGLTVSAILTGNGREFFGADAHPYELCLALNDVEKPTHAS